MKTHISKRQIVAVLLALASVGAAQTTTPPDNPDLVPAAQLELKEPLLNKISVSYRMGINIKADFSKLGGYPRMTDPGPATGSTYNRNYDNGYNRVDVSGNADGLTWYWGYQNPASVSGSSLSLQSSASPNNVESNNHYDDPQHGFEISYSRELYRKPKWSAGAEVAFAFSPISISDNRTLMGKVNRITDTYSLGDIVPPLAPYNGTYLGPGALIDSDPERVRRIISEPAVITGKRTLDSDVYLFRLGPYVEVPLWKKFSAIFSGGMTLAVADSDFSYTEAVSIGDVGTVHRSSSGSQTDFLVGWYVGGALSYAIDEKWSVFAGFQFQAAGDATTDSKIIGKQAMSAKEAVIDLGESLIVTIGASYKF